MNWAHWHMILVHFPLAGCITAVALLIGARLWGATLLVPLLAGYLMAWTGSLGGEVVHLEIRGHRILPAPEL